MTSPFLDQFSEALAKADISSARFEFAYMEVRRTSGIKRPPPPVAKLAQEYLAVIDNLPACPHRRLFIGGKSMGGRVASLIAEELYMVERITGVIVLGYPFHPPRKPDSLRIEHLLALTCPTLILQGTRDALGSAAEVATYRLPANIMVTWLPDGDHDLKPRKSSGTTQAHHFATGIAAIAKFMAQP